MCDFFLSLLFRRQLSPYLPGPLAHHPARLFNTPLNSSWLSAVRTLGALSSLDPKAVGLENFGSHKPYFPRQIKSLSKVTLAQAAVRDVDSGEPVGEIPGWRELLAWYERNLPDERKTGGARIVHGDYKLDNLVFHPTENRVIGILDWELCTLGSPVRARAMRAIPTCFIVSRVGLTNRGCFNVAGGFGKLDATLGP